MSSIKNTARLRRAKSTRAHIRELGVPRLTVLRTLAPGAVIAIHTTVTLDTIHVLAAEAAAHGVTLIDAGISGGEAGAAAGTLLTMVGGADAAVAICAGQLARALRPAR